jgi:hypothetical protein
MLSLSGASVPALPALNRGARVEDAKGRLIGSVQRVNRTARGRIESVTMRVGDRLATLPASNFSADGDVLVSAMGKGAVKDAAKSGDGGSSSSAAPASNGAKGGAPIGQEKAEAASHH